MKRMWLVQTGRFKRDEEIDNAKEVIGFSHIVDLKYMGAAEFEMTFAWVNGKQELVNPLALSVKRFVKNRENYKYVKITKRKDAFGNQMYIYCKEEDETEAVAAARELAKGEPCKRYAGLDTYLKSSKESLEDDLSKPGHLGRKMNFWWDIENDILIFFGEDKFEKIDGVLDILHEKWKEELFPPVKVSVIDRIKMIFSRKEKVKA